MVNKVIYVGRIVAKPVMSNTTKNTEVVNFRLAVEETWKNGDGNLKRNTEYIRCVAWGKLARTIVTFLDKGDVIYVEGRTKKAKSFDEKTNTKYEVDEAHIKYMKMIVTKGKVAAEELPPLPEDVPF